MPISVTIFCTVEHPFYTLWYLLIIFQYPRGTEMVYYGVDCGDCIGNAIPKNLFLLPNPNARVAISKGMRTVKQSSSS